MTKVTDYMLNLMRETLDETETLRAAIWGGVENTKSSPALENRKRSTLQDLDKLIAFLQQTKQEVSDLRMVGDKGRNE